MAYIYRYQFKNLELREKINLKEYNDKIQLIISSHFRNNLKDIIIKTKSFEFKLYSTVDQNILQKMGKSLKKKLEIKDSNYGFVRMEQTLYALVYLDSEDDNSLDVEFIDSMLVEDFEEYKKRAEKYFVQRNQFFENRYDHNRDEIVNNYYIDVLDTYINKERALKTFETKEEIGCFLVKGYLRRLTKVQLEDKKNNYDNKIIKLEKNFDLAYLEMPNFLPNKSEYIDCLVVNEVKSKSKKTKEIIDYRLKLQISESESIEVLNNIKSNKKMEFRVHNVGQALATSLSYENDSPFIYFDYGTPFGENAHTKPLNINTPTKEKSTIVISHNHKDHWYRLADEIKAYTCNWLIPDQLVKKQFGHKLSEIISKGGSVQLIKKNFKYDNYKIICNCISKIKSSRPATHFHETGLILRLEVLDSNKEQLNILILGDQRYDYIDSQYLEDIDILVASHHGGEYSWSLKDSVPTPRNNESKIIYSYGKDNSHNHPSEISKYRLSNWNNEHHTSLNDEFKIEVFSK